MGRKIKSNKNIGRKWKDPETYFSQVLIKDKFKDIDNLDESVDDLPPGQKYMLVSFVEPDPGLQELWECFTFGKFLMKAGNTIVKKAFEKKNMEFLLKQYKNYKQINHKYINKEFAKKYGKDYDHRRIFKIYGVYPDVKTADKKKDEIAQDNKHLGVGVFRQQMGFFVPFNPSIEDCKDFKSTNKSMNELMGGQMMHTRGMKSLYNERKKILREKYIKDQEENGGSAKLKEVIDSDGKKHSAEEYLKNSDKRKMTKEEIDEEFDLFTPKNLLSMKHKEESTKHEKMLKDLVKTEMSINDGELLNPEIINELNISKKEKRLVKKKVLISKNKMKKRIEDIKKNNAKLLKGKSINTKRKK